MTGPELCASDDEERPSDSTEPLLLRAMDESQVGPGRTSGYLREFVSGAGPDDELKQAQGLGLAALLGRLTAH